MNIRIEIGTNLYLEIENVRYTPAEPMVWRYKDGSGYPGCDAEITWDDEDCKLENHVTEYQAPEGFADDYYDLILNEVENGKQSDI